MFVRVAQLKYIKKFGNFEEAVVEFFENEAIPFFKKFNIHQFRANQIWREPIDYVLKTHKLIVDNIWTRYSGKKTLPGKKKFMSLEEFRNLIFNAEIDKEIAERDITIVFNISIMTQGIYSFSY